MQSRGGPGGDANEMVERMVLVSSRAGDGPLSCRRPLGRRRARRLPCEEGMQSAVEGPRDMPGVWGITGGARPLGPALTEPHANPKLARPRERAVAARLSSVRHVAVSDCRHGNHRPPERIGDRLEQRAL